MRSMADLTTQHTEYRLSHFGGTVYLAVEGFLWLTAASLGAAGQIPAAMLTLLVGGMFIHPIASALSRFTGIQAPSEANRLWVLITWISLTIPMALPLVFMATAAGRENMFFPAFTVIVGAHWLPFSYVYSMRSFIALAVILVLTGTLFGFVLTQSFSACGFVAGGIHLLFAVVHYFVVHRESKRASTY